MAARFPGRHAIATLAFITAAMQWSCASIDRKKSPADAAAAQLRQGGAGLAPTHQLREWRLEADTGGFVQLILSSSGVYMMRHGYFFTDKQSGTAVTMMLSEANIGTYSLQGQKLFLHGPAKSSCRERVGIPSSLEMEISGKDILMDDFSSRNFVFDDFKGRRAVVFQQQFMGTLDKTSGLPAAGRDDDGRFESKLGCVQMGSNGQISFRP